MQKSNIWVIVVVIVLSFVGIGMLQFQDSLFSKKEASHTNRLTPQEQAWLEHLKRPLRVGITHIPNQVILQEGKEPVGFSIDVFSHLATMLHTTFEYVPYKAWEEVIDVAKRRDIDIVFLAQKTPERLGFLNFTDTVLSQHNHIIVRTDDTTIQDVNDLHGKKVALVRYSAIESYIDQAYPDVTVVSVERELDALRAVAAKQADATISEPVRAGALMKANGIKNVMIVGDLGYDYDLKIASRSDLPELNTILTKAVNNLSPSIRRTLYLKWGYLKEKDYFLNKETWVFLLIAFGIILPFSLYLFLINRSLKKEVKLRQEAEEELRTLNRELETKVQEEVARRRAHEVYMLEQEKYAQLGTMMTMIAHQWKQPLHALSLLTQTVVVKYRKSILDDRAVSDFETHSKRQIDQMQTVMQEFMDFFKPKRFETFTIDAIVKRTLNIIEETLKVDGIAIVYEHRFANDQPVYHDALAQVILNILNNAKDALIERNITQKRIDIRVFEQEGHPAITIEDNAGGIADDVIDTIFDPYVTTRNKGTGLGLYMSRVIVVDHFGGRLEVSNTAKGACFTIVLSS